MRMKMTEKIYWTSDTHFGHKSILHLGTGRPFSSVEEMDEAMIARWNERVDWDDDIWFLGDFTFYNSTKTSEVLSRLQGRKHLIWGNHDKPLKNKLSFFESEQHYKEITVNGQKIIMFHYPIESWHSVGQGSWHLHGHCHNNLPQTDMARLDIGVDGHDFTPWSFEEIARELKNRTGLPGDHHGAGDNDAVMFKPHKGGLRPA